ncbi:hypothetical protein [Enterococcus sp. N249-2]
MKKTIGILLLVVGVLILIFLNNFIEPRSLEDMPTTEYNIRMSINAARYLIMACILSFFGIKLILKDL